MLTPEINIVEQTSKLLDDMNDGDILDIATNNVVTVYTIRAYVVKHAAEYDVEYRYYTQDNYKLDDPSKYQLIKPADPGAYGSYGGDWNRGKGISTEILIDIIQQLTDEPEKVTFENFVNRYFTKYGFSHEVRLESSKEKYYFSPSHKYYLAKPINLITKPKTVKKFMPVYTYEQLTPENITQIVDEDFVQARAYTFNEMFKDLSSENKYEQEKGLILLIRLIAQDRNGRKNHDAFALLLPDFDIEDIYNELDQHKQFVSVENKNLVYSLNKL